MNFREISCEFRDDEIHCLWFFSILLLSNMNLSVNVNTVNWAQDERAAIGLL